MKRFPSVGDTDPGGARQIGPVLDCHAHLWPEALVEGLRARRRPPMLRGWTLHLPGEPAYDVDPADHDLGQRHKIDAADGTDRVLYSLSSPLGLESLPSDEAAPLLAAWHGLADQLDERGGVWAAAGLVEPDPDHLGEVLAHPRVVGVQVPATAMADPVALERTAPLLAVAEARDLPVLVHPGPVPGSTPGSVPHSGPAWWPALTAYPAQQAAAWFAWHVAGRALLPTLRLGFVALAGLAPLHHERLEQRGGALGRIDPGVYYETSSYGTRAIDTLVRVVGVDPMVHGSDRPYAAPTDPGLGGAFGRALFVTNPHHLLNGGPR